MLRPDYPTHHVYYRFYYDESVVLSSQSLKIHLYQVLGSHQPLHLFIQAAEQHVRRATNQSCRLIERYSKSPFQF